MSSQIVPFIPSAEAKPKKLLDQLRDVIRTKHYSIRTEETYVLWAKRFIFFHDKRHPAAMGAEEVKAFLTDLAVRQNVSAKTQNQAQYENLPTVCFQAFRLEPIAERPWPAN